MSEAETTWQEAPGIDQGKEGAANGPGFEGPWIRLRCSDDERQRIRGYFF